MQRFSKRTQRWIAALLAAIFLGASAWLAVRVGKPMTQLVRDSDQLRAWLDALGWKARLVYIGMVCFQVIVAVIPGEPLELAAGFAFGAFEGTLICLAGITLGSVIVFGLVRLFGVRLVRLFFSQEKIESLSILKNREKLFKVTALLMIFPGTPKDLLTYCAGLTPIGFGTWLLICSVGRIPSVVTSTLGGHYVQQGNYPVAVLIFAGTALLCLAGFWLFGKMRERSEKKEKE